jgi:hypothetical protein
MFKRATLTLTAALASSSLCQSALVLDLKFDGNTDDATGTNTASIQNGATYSGDTPTGTGQSIGLMNGDVENQGVLVTANASLGANPFTLAYWIKPASAQGNAGLERITSRAGDAFETAIGDANALGGTSSSTGVTLSYYQGGWNVTDVAIPVGEWTHVTWVNSGDGATGMELFVDGASAFTGPGVGGGRPGSDFMKIGTRHNDVEGFEGNLDGLQVYDSPLSADEVARLAVVPEPSSVLLLLAGAFGFALRRRR